MRSRHTYAVRNARHGASVETLRRLLGHSSVATTGRYLDHLGQAEVIALMNVVCG